MNPPIGQILKRVGYSLKLHFFDLDRTLCVKNVSFAFCFYLIKQGIVPVSSLIKTVPLYFQRPPLEKIHRVVFRHVLEGLFFSDLRDLAETFLDKELEKLLCPKVFPLAEQAKKNGEKIFLLSSSPHYLVEKIARRFCFDLCAGTEYGVDKEGRICEIKSLITGLEKREIASRWAEIENATVKTAAYSDSQDDLPLLEWADTAILVRPSRSFRKIARSQNWTII